MSKRKIVITKNGPYLVSGGLSLKVEVAAVNSEGTPEHWVCSKQYPHQENYALCRCGKSDNKPFCDGAHSKSNFDGTETASRELFVEKAEHIAGPNLDLKDRHSLCAKARFCHLHGGTWNAVRNSSNPEAKNDALQSACNCPAGRLVAYDKNSGKPIEPTYDETSLSLIEDPQLNTSGPIWAKGGIEIEASDGTKLETRNRVTLCRCGRSSNKPYCDGSHIYTKFNDGDESLQQKT